MDDTTKVNFFLWRDTSRTTPIDELLEATRFNKDHDYRAQGLLPGQAVSNYVHIDRNHPRDGIQRLIVRHQNDEYFQGQIVAPCSPIFESMGVLPPDDFVALFHEAGKIDLAAPEIDSVVRNLMQNGYSVLATFGHKDYAASLQHSIHGASRTIQQMAADAGYQLPVLK